MAVMLLMGRKYVREIGQFTRGKLWCVWFSSWAGGGSEAVSPVLLGSHILLLRIVRLIDLKRISRAVFAGPRLDKTRCFALI